MHPDDGGRRTVIYGNTPCSMRKSCPTTSGERNETKSVYPCLDIDTNMYTPYRLLLRRDALLANGFHNSPNFTNTYTAREYTVAGILLHWDDVALIRYLFFIKHD